MSEVPNNVDTTTGMLGLTDTEENQIVAFLQTLTDGYTTPYPNVNTFTGTCQTGGSAATQGNEAHPDAAASALRRKRSAMSRRHRGQARSHNASRLTAPQIRSGHGVSETSCPDASGLNETLNGIRG